MNRTDIYPIGQQDFKTLRQGGAVYVDKTRFVEKIVTSKSQYHFLARPHRFGKSLFLSTLRYFFEGRHDLFSGLDIDARQWDWEKHPVLYLDLNSGEYTDPNNLETTVDNLLRKWEDIYRVKSPDTDLTSRFRSYLCPVLDGAFRHVSSVAMPASLPPRHAKIARPKPPQGLLKFYETGS